MKPKFVRARKDVGTVELECVHNRELTETTDSSERFFYLSNAAHDQYGVDQVYGEILLYSPTFRKDIGSPWVGLASDFEDVMSV